MREGGGMSAFLRRHFWTMVGVLALAMVMLASAVFAMRGAIHGAEVTVPNLSGMGLAEAENKTEALGLGMEVENRLYSAIVPIGRVMGQSPTAGTVVRREWQVRVAESLGPQKVAIPDVMGEPMRVAAIAIERVGLELGSLVHLPGTGTVADLVIAQSPPPTATGADRPRVSLLLSSPAGSTAYAYVMPDLTGMSYSAASALVARADLKMGTPVMAAALIPAVKMGGVMAPVKATALPGMVMGQVPAAGERVTTADVVRLTVAM
jgi:beta-lactam-binding protein with PASTA domain